MRFIIEKAIALLPEFKNRIVGRIDRGPIDSCAKLYAFTGSRAAYVSQKTLYGYLKTRIGTRYPSMFEDEVFVQSVNIAKLEVFAACLSDLAIYTVARATEGVEMPAEWRRKAALECHATALVENAGGEPSREDVDRWTADFLQRLNHTVWQGGALQSDNFTASPKALFDWAPIAPQLKQHDEEIVHNSIKFAWHEIRIQFRKRLDSAAISRELADSATPV